MIIIYEMLRPMFYEFMEEVRDLQLMWYDFFELHGIGVDGAEPPTEEVSRSRGDEALFCKRSWLVSDELSQKLSPGWWEVLILRRNSVHFTSNVRKTILM